MYNSENVDCWKIQSFAGTELNCVIYAYYFHCQTFHLHSFCFIIRRDTDWQIWKSVWVLQRNSVSVRSLCRVSLLCGVECAKRQNLIVLCFVLHGWVKCVRHSSVPSCNAVWQETGASAAKATVHVWEYVRVGRPGRVAVCRAPCGCPLI